MAEIDLKAYTTRAKELESAIYTQKQLMFSQETLIKEQHPKTPQKKEINPPTKPELRKFNNNINVGFLFFIGLMIFTGILGLIGLFVAGFNIPVIACLVFGVLGGICAYSEWDEKKSTDNLNRIAEEL